MVLLTLAIVIPLTIAGVFLFFRTRSNQTNLVRNAVVVGCVLGVIRAGLASLGWYVVEHTGGPLQVPAFALAMLAWPEAAILDERRTTAAPFSPYLRLFLLLVVSTTVLISAIAILARRRLPR